MPAIELPKIGLDHQRGAPKGTVRHDGQVANVIDVDRDPATDCLSQYVVSPRFANCDRTR